MLRRRALNQWGGRLAATIVLLAAPAVSPALAGQESITTATDRQGETDTVRPGRIVSSQVELARERARLLLELDDGRTLEFGLHDGQAWAGDRALGPAPRGEALDRAWRELLDNAMETPAEELAALLTGWTPAASASGARVTLYNEMVAALSGVTGQGTATVGGPLDTVARLNQRIAELEQRLHDGGRETTASGSRRRSGSVSIEVDPSRSVRVKRAQDSWYSPLRHVGRGFMAILGDLVILSVLVGIGFAVVFFGRKHLEAVADTARHETLRAGLVGLAATFLVLPGYVLGIIALAISIVGIPLLLAWVPLFWVAVAVAALFGYLAVGHGIGEALAERRFYGGEWAKRANSYYYVLTGLVTLFALFLASHAVQMAGPWLGFIRGLLMFMGVTLTWIAFTIGFGAVLLTRGGTRPRTKPAPVSEDLDMGDLFEEEPSV